MFERCKYANECDAQCSGAIENSETCDSFQLHQELEQAVNQYNQVVKQNKDLQAESNHYKNGLRNILDYCTEFQAELGQPDMLCIEIKNRIYEVLNG